MRYKRGTKALLQKQGHPCDDQSPEILEGVGGRTKKDANEPRAEQNVKENRNPKMDKRERRRGRIEGIVMAA
jgi:hypothetical protein